MSKKENMCCQIGSGVATSADVETDADASADIVVVEDFGCDVYYTRTRTQRTAFRIVLWPIHLYR